MVGPAGQLVKVLDVVAQADDAAWSGLAAGKWLICEVFRGYLLVQGCLLAAHGRPRSDRKKRFLLSAVAPSTITRHPREARPINWAQRGGLASGGKLSPDAEATFHCAIMHAW